MQSRRGPSNKKGGRGRKPIMEGRGRNTVRSQHTDGGPVSDVSTDTGKYALQVARHHSGILFL